MRDDPRTHKLMEGFYILSKSGKYLRVFLDDASVPLDNNAAEIAIRPFTTGRKNWVIIDTPGGAEASAGIYSIVETAKANGLKLYPYFTYLLEEPPTCWKNFQRSSMKAAQQCLTDFCPGQKKSIKSLVCKTIPIDTVKCT